MQHYTYILLLVSTLAFPLYKSFEKKIEFYKNWKHLFPSILISAVIFIVADVWFTSIGIWKFNPDYVIGINILNLPIEEWLFFFIAPFSSVFIHEVLNYFVKKNPIDKYASVITYTLIGFCAVIAGLNTHKIYTAVLFTSLAGFLLLHLALLKTEVIGKFFLTWLVCCIPFAIFDGFITAMPIAVYNDAENLGIRLYTIPLEDVFYCMLNLLLVITCYEYFKRRKTI